MMLLNPTNKHHIVFVHAFIHKNMVINVVNEYNYNCGEYNFYPAACAAV